MACEGCKLDLSCWQALVNMVMTLGSSEFHGISLPAVRLLASQEKLHFDSLCSLMLSNGSVFAPSLLRMQTANEPASTPQLLKGQGCLNVSARVNPPSCVGTCLIVLPPSVARLDKIYSYLTGLTRIDYYRVYHQL
jgi:hypothetical protein